MVKNKRSDLANGASPRPQASQYGPQSLSFVYLLASTLCIIAIGGAAVWFLQRGNPLTPTTPYEIIATYPHDPAAFTQGLVITDGRLFESTGHYGSSSLRRVELETGRVLQRLRLDEDLFAEGIVVRDDRIIMLTWRSGKGLVFERETFAEIRHFDLEGEGWGLTQDDQHLIMSDGTASLRFLDPDSYTTVRSVEVLEDGEPARKLNELEYVNGEIWANVWFQEYVLRISPEDGTVLGRIYLGDLHPPGERAKPENVLNGIAYDEVYDRLFVTGKNWPNLFEIRILPEEAS